MFLTIFTRCLNVSECLGHKMGHFYELRVGMEESERGHTWQLVYLSVGSRMSL